MTYGIKEGTGWLEQAEKSGMGGKFGKLSGIR